MIFDMIKFKISASLNHPIAMYFDNCFIKIPVTAKAKARYKNQMLQVIIKTTINKVVKTRLVSVVLALSNFMFKKWCK